MMLPLVASVGILIMWRLGRTVAAAYGSSVLALGQHWLRIKGQRAWRELHSEEPSP